MRKATMFSAVRPQLVASTALAAAAVLGGSAYASAAGTAPTADSVSAVSTAAPNHVHVTLHPSSPALAACFPHAKANVDVALTTDRIGKDTLTIKAYGLKPRTDYTVFLLQKAGAPFGAAEYIGDFTTNRHGRATNGYNLIVEEAFAFNNQTGTRTDLNSVGVWFADPKDDNGCLGNGSPVTGFDGDASAGVQMLNSGTHKLP
jgi:hypothetical protein